MEQSGSSDADSTESPEQSLGRINDESSGRQDYSTTDGGVDTGRDDWGSFVN